MSKYFNVDVIPDCIGGDVSDNNGTGDVGAGDVIFNWTAVDVPKGSCLLKNITAFVNAEDGAKGDGSLTDYEIVFAKSINGVAPSNLGDINSVQSGCGELRSHFVGSVRLEGEAAKGTLSKTTFGVIYNSTTAYSGQTIGPGFIIDLEPASGTNVGYDTLYVAAFQILARNYGTGVLLDQAGDADYDASEDLQNSYIVDGVDATKIFSVGDQVYVADLDTPIPGVLTKVEPLLLTFSEVNSTVDISNNDELLNANPIRIRLGFES